MMNYADHILVMLVVRRSWEKYQVTDCSGGWASIKYWAIDWLTRYAPSPKAYPHNLT